MRWLLRWLGLDGTGGATLRSVAIGWRGPVPPWVAAAGASVVLVAAIALYRSERARIGVTRRAVLALLRGASGAVVVLLLARPSLVLEYRGERPRGVALLLDDSRSMALRDPRTGVGDRLRVAIAEGRVDPKTSWDDRTSIQIVPPGMPADPSRLDVARAALGNRRLALMDRLARLGPLRVARFGERLRDLDDPSAWDAGSPRTALADAIAAALDPDRGDPPAAIVVATDGHDNASRLALDDVARACAKGGVALHVYGVGVVDAGNLRLLDATVPEAVVVGDTVAIPVRWSAVGFAGGTAELTLRLDEEVVAQQNVDISDSGDRVTTLTFTPKGDRVGSRVFSATIRRDDREAVVADNEARRPTRVVDAKVRVLVIEDAPRWEYRFLQTALLRDPRVSARFHLIQGDPRALNSGPPYAPTLPANRAELFDEDVVILGDVDASALGTDRLGWLRDFVAEGGGLIAIAGRRHAPWGYRESPIAEVLPVDFPGTPPPFDAEARTEAFTPELTRDGERSELLALADEPAASLTTWRSLPGFHWIAPTTRLRPGATALIVHPSLTADGAPLPWLAAQPYGRGTCLFLAGDETWRWRLNAGDRHFARFWGQVIYRAGLPHLLGGSSRVRLAPERPAMTVGQPSSIFARLLDSDYQPWTRERVTARLEALDAPSGSPTSRAIELRAVPGRPGEYRATLANDAAGRFAFRLAAPEPAAIEFRVDPPPDDESQAAGLPATALRTLAKLGGGAFYREEDLHRLPDAIAPRSASFTDRREVSTWHPLTFALFVALLSAEWTLRRFSNMS
ncbi:MAG TPA: hypothetical protein VG406_10770 [Isosphaeraceae bacterium]|jgi:hypothetical protein|nr:hypothetical protein [Isosphaeraceae bacterium]